MPHHDDNEEPELDCPLCGWGFHTFARLDEHMAEHEGPKRTADWHLGQISLRPLFFGSALITYALREAFEHSGLLPKNTCAL